MMVSRTAPYPTDERTTPSKRREWATFPDKRGALCQMYWRQGRSVYQLGRYGADGNLRMIGQFVDRDAAIAVALPGGSSARSTDTRSWPP